MKPIARVEGHLLMGVTPDTRPPPAEFAEFFSDLAMVSGTINHVSARKVAALGALADAAETSQVFDFGELREHQLIEEAKLGGRLMSERSKGKPLLGLPYPSVLYWYTLTDLVANGAKIDLPAAGIDRVRYATLVTEYADQLLVADFMLLDPQTGSLARRDIAERNTGSVLKELQRGKHVFLCCGIGSIAATEDGRWAGYLLDRPGDEESGDRDSAQMGSLADGVAAMTMILSTKGVGIRREPAPEKVNKHRAQAGKAPYPAVTHINTREYFEAASRTSQGGTHASPVPHLRRGHRRTYSDGRVTWVRSAMVNCRSLADAQPRERYEVEV